MTGPSSVSHDRQLKALEQRLDRQALDQLRAEVSRLAAENEQLAVENGRLRSDLTYMEDVADDWRKDALGFQMELCQRDGGSPGIDINGRLQVVAG